VLFLGVLWAVGLGRIVASLLAGAFAFAALLELAAAVQGVGLRRVLRRVGTAARSAGAVARVRVRPGSRWLATAFAKTAAAAPVVVRQLARHIDAWGRLGVRVARATTARAAVTARPLAARGAAAAAEGVRRARRRHAAAAAEREARRLNELGARLRRSGAPEAAAERHRAALAIVRELGDRRAEALTLNNVALALAPSDDAAAVTHFEQAATIFRQLGDSHHEAQVIANLGIAHRRQGRSDEADRLLQTALAKLDPETPEHRQIEAQLRRAS
jgi:tetratricopeptide (TPR) repeat protein